MEFVENLKKSAKKCQSLPGILKKFVLFFIELDFKCKNIFLFGIIYFYCRACFMKLKLSAARQADRLKALLPDVSIKIGISKTSMCL